MSKQNAFNNITKADLLHGFNNRKEHYRKENRPSKVPNKPVESVKLSDLVDLEQFIKENIK